MIVWRSLTALAVLIVSLSVSIAASADAQAGSRHGGYGGRAFSGHSLHGSSFKVARMAPVNFVRPHYAVAPFSRSQAVAAFAPRVYHGHRSYAAGYGHAQIVRYAASAPQVRYINYQPTVYRQPVYAAAHRMRAPRSHCVC
jgi:hypothetical protein